MATDILDGNLPHAYLPDTIGAQVLALVREESRTALVAATDSISTASIAYPRVTSDVPVTWLAEGAPFPTDGPGLDEVVVVPTKVGAMTRLSSEAFADSPNAPATVSQSLAASIARSIDKAFVTTVAAPAPQGLSTITFAAANTVTAGVASVNLDWVTDAAAAVELAGGAATAVLVSPATAAYLAKLKSGSASNETLLQADPTTPTVRMANGLPLVVFRDLPDGIGYVIDGSRTRLVIRDNAKVDVSTDRYFDTGHVAVRATARVGFGLVDPRCVVKVKFSA